MDNNDASDKSSVSGASSDIEPSESASVRSVPGIDHAPIPDIHQTIENAEVHVDSAVDEYGFHASSVISKPNNNSKVHKLEEAWLALLQNWNPTKNNKQIKQLVRKGIPDSLRATVWQKLANVSAKKIPTLYQALLARNEHPPIFDEIERDIHRCYPNHQMFAKTGQGFFWFDLVRRISG